jgi:hypothetical protein
VDIHFVRDKQLGEVHVLHIPTSSQFPDIFTKGLPSGPFRYFRSSLTVPQATVDTVGDVRLDLVMHLSVLSHSVYPCIVWIVRHFSPSL